MYSFSRERMCSTICIANKMSWGLTDDVLGQLILTKYAGAAVFARALMTLLRLRRPTRRPQNTTSPLCLIKL